MQRSKALPIALSSWQTWGMARLIVYGISPENSDALIYIGRSSRGLARPYSHFFAPSACHNHELYLWLHSIGERRFDPEAFVRILAIAENVEELARLEVEHIAAARKQGHPLMNTLDRPSPHRRRIFSFACDPELYDLARDIAAMQKTTIEQMLESAIIRLCNESGLRRF